MTEQHLLSESMFNVKIQSHNKSRMQTMDTLLTEFDDSNQSVRISIHKWFLLHCVRFNSFFFNNDVIIVCDGSC